MLQYRLYLLHDFEGTLEYISLKGPITESFQKAKPAETFIYWSRERNIFMKNHATIILSHRLHNSV